MLDVLFALLDAVKNTRLTEKEFMLAPVLCGGEVWWQEAEVVVPTVLSQETRVGWI